MTHFTDMTGLASSAAAMAAAVALLPGMARHLAGFRLALLACTVVIAALIPFAGLPLAAYVRGAIGDLSITSLMLLVLAVLSRTCAWRPVNAKPRLALLSLIALAALVLYPMALGMGFFDPYRLGYGNPWFMGALLAVALIACFRQLHVVALCIALAVLAWGIGWYESNNLWDYLLDPLVSIYTIYAIMKYGMQVLLNKAG